MPLRVAFHRAEVAATRVNQNFPELRAIPISYGNKGYYVAVSRAGTEGGLVLHPDEIDNGASGVKDDCLVRLACFRDGKEYVKPVSTQRFVYDDVMTTENFGG